jgi:hypothetical protein
MSNGFAEYAPAIDPPAKIKQYHVYSYEHLDELRFMPLATDVLQTVSKADEILSTVRALFEEAGWEGDGDLQVMWLPPFVGAGVEDTHGVFIWHVKQENNGTSWLASPVSLPFPSLRKTKRPGPRRP